MIALPQFLPPLLFSGFFHNSLFVKPPPLDLIRTYIPDNIFSALSADNFPAVVLFSSVLGILLQRQQDRQQLLAPLEVMRRVFLQLNRLTVRVIPYGIFALSSLTIARLDAAQLVKIQALLLLCLSLLLLLTILLASLVLGLTPLDPAGLWRIVRGPLALTASSGNLLIALPMLMENLRVELPRHGPPSLP